MTKVARIHNMADDAKQRKDEGKVIYNNKEALRRDNSID